MTVTPVPGTLMSAKHMLAPGCHLSMRNTHSLAVAVLSSWSMHRALGKLVQPIAHRRALWLTLARAHCVEWSRYRTQETQFLARQNVLLCLPCRGSSPPFAQNFQLTFSVSLWIEVIWPFEVNVCT